MVLHHECYSIEKEANKRHSGRLINQDQSGRIEATRMISVLFTLDLGLRPRSRVITNLVMRRDSSPFNFRKFSL